MIARCKLLLKPEIFTLPRVGTFVMHPGTVLIPQCSRLLLGARPA